MPCPWQKTRERDSFHIHAFILALGPYLRLWLLNLPLAAGWRSSDLVHLACSPFLPSLLIIHLTLHTMKCEARRSELMSSGSRPACLVSLHTGEVLLYILWGPQNEGDSLVNTLRLHIQYRLGACGCHASCLLDNIGHGIAFIQEPELQTKGGQVRTFLKRPDSPRHAPKYWEQRELLSCLCDSWAWVKHD